MNEIAEVYQEAQQDDTPTSRGIGPNAGNAETFTETIADDYAIQVAPRTDLAGAQDRFYVELSASRGNEAPFHVDMIDLMHSGLRKLFVNAVVASDPALSRDVVAETLTRICGKLGVPGGVQKTAEQAAAPTTADDGRQVEPKKRRPDVEDAARHLATNGREWLAYDKKCGCWRGYEDETGFWRNLPDGWPNLDTVVVWSLEDVGLARTPHNIDATLRLARRHLPRNFDAPRRAIAFQNGTLDLETGQLREHRADDNLTRGLPYDYTPDAPAPLSEHLLEERIPDPTARDAFRAQCGLALLGDTTFHHALLLIGGTATGKTTLLRLYNIVLGQDPDMFTSGSLFLRDHEGQLQRAECRDWMGVALDEFPDTALKDEDTFKAMVAHAGVSSRRHQQAPVNAKWMPKIVIATNDLPKLIDRSGAIARRLVVIECPNTIQGSWDRSLADKLIAEAGPFAAQCLAAARRVIQRNEFPISDAMRDAFEELAGASDPIKAWVRERCTLTVHDGKDHKAYTGDLFADWQAWAEKNGHYAGSSSTLSRRLRSYPAWKIAWSKDRKSSRLLGIGLR